VSGVVCSSGVGGGCGEHSPFLKRFPSARTRKEAGGKTSSTPVSPYYK